MQTNLAHLHGQFHTPPGLHRHLNILQMTCHLLCASGQNNGQSLQSQKKTQMGENREQLQGEFQPF